MKTETYFDACLSAYRREHQIIQLLHHIGGTAAQEAEAHSKLNKYRRQRIKFYRAVMRDIECITQQRNSALAALAAAQAMTQELAQMRTLIVEVRDKVARLERQLMTADERRLAEVHRAGK